MLRLRNEHHRGLGEHPQIMSQRSNALRHQLSFITPRIEPEEIVAAIAHSTFVEKRMSSAQFSLRIVDQPCSVAVKYFAKARFKVIDITFATLPRGCRSKQSAVPNLIEQ